MKHILSIIVIGVVAIGLAASGAAAQEIETDGTNATVDLGGEKVEEQIDSNVRLTEWSETESGGIRLTFDADKPTRVTVTSQDELSAGVGRMAIQRERVLPGGSTITIADTEAVAITTSETINNGYGVTVSLTDQGGSSLPSTSIAHGVLIGLVTMTLGMAIAVNRKRNVDHMKVDSGWKED